MAQKIIFPLLLIVVIGLSPAFYQFLIGYTPGIIYRCIILVGIIVAYLFAKTDWKHTRLYKLPLLKIAQITLAYYCIYLIFITIFRYYNFNSEVIDLSYYHIAVWQLSEFHVPHIWDIPSRFVWDDHFEPILFLFVPFYWISKAAVMLFFSQVAIVVSGVMPIYLIAKEKFKNSFIGISLSFAYLLFGGLQMGYAYGFHPIVLFPTFFFWTYYFLEKKKIRYYFLFLFLTLLIKEEVTFTVMAFGLYILLFKKNRKIGFLTVVMGIAWYIICFNVVFPYFSNGKGFGHLGQYGELGSGGMLGLLENIFLKPRLFLTTLITPVDKIDTILHSFGSFAFLPFFFPPALLIVIPALLEKLLSSNIARLNGFHYSAVITGVILIATIESLAFILKRKFHLFTTLSNINFWTIFILYVAFMTNAFFGYGYFSLFNNKSTILSWPKHVSSLYQIINNLPVSASVSAQYQITPHINREYGKILPAPHLHENSDYVVLDLHIPLVLTSVDDFKDYFMVLTKNKKYKLMYALDGIVVFKKMQQ